MSSMEKTPYLLENHVKCILHSHLGNISILDTIWPGCAECPYCILHSRTVHLIQRQPRWLSALRRSRVHSLVIARRSLCPEKLGSNPGQGSKGINFSGWHGLDMSITVTKRR